MDWQGRKTALKRRRLLLALSAGALTSVGTTVLVGRRSGPVEPLTVYEDVDATPVELARSIRVMTTPAPGPGAFPQDFVSVGDVKKTREAASEGDELSYFEKMKNFENSHPGDLFLPADQFPVMVAAFKRMDRIQAVVGHGNFNVLCFDDMLKFARRYSRAGTFTPAEVTFLDALFHENATRYGFYGAKVTSKLTERVPERDRVKVPYTGHYLYRGTSLATYSNVEKDLDQKIVLTSGIRSVVKQSYLFIAKAITAEGNLSRASRSLAPPGHSFHGIGDFDVGKIGFGRRNFTTAFAQTPEYRKLVDLGYVDMRYPLSNLLGVRYEPWHIQVV